MIITYVNISRVQFFRYTSVITLIKLILNALKGFRVGLVYYPV
jgi:hypothetical protein